MALPNEPWSLDVLPYNENGILDAVRLAGFLRFLSRTIIFAGQQEFSRLLQTGKSTARGWGVVVSHWTRVARGEPGLFGDAADARP